LAAGRFGHQRVLYRIRDEAQPLKQFDKAVEGERSVISREALADRHQQVVELIVEIVEELVETTRLLEHGDDRVDLAVAAQRLEDLDDRDLFWCSVEAASSTFK